MQRATSVVEPGMAEASAATTIYAYDGHNVYSSGGACLRHARPHRSVGCLRKMWVTGRLWTSHSPGTNHIKIRDESCLCCQPYLQYGGTYSMMQSYQPELSQRRGMLSSLHLFLARTGQVLLVITVSVSLLSIGAFYQVPKTFSRAVSRK